MNDADLERPKRAHHYAFHGTLAQQSILAKATICMGGTVRALQEFRHPDTGQQCRKVIEDIRSTAGARDIRIGTACRQDDCGLVVVYGDRADTDGED